MWYASIAWQVPHDVHVPELTSRLPVVTQELGFVLLLATAASADDACILEVFSITRLTERSSMPFNLAAFLAGVALITSRLVESATYTYPLGLAHCVGLLSLFLLQGAFAFRDLHLLLPLDVRRWHLRSLLFAARSSIILRIRI
jgi:hypothetical protein